ncbi:Puromycin-sensitive aminopeptidase [Smittium mucronatum]|uniref:Puromycin-sensitive aminopeptidase n=1 Tax=Smittium mucronatum TaxID=133383 RepID=A0A1R0GVH0_9FUNG|nr:Puromycin-sensitive aminopeptidase [Smittium mucronatum]
MENWGLVIYGDDDLFAWDGLGSIIEKSKLAETICHETAHQWIGNLATNKSWDNLWLNEGISNWIQYKCSQRLVADPDSKARYYSEDYQRFLKQDSLVKSLPVVHNVKTSAEAQNMLNAITYFKGAAVANMLENLLGTDALLNGLCVYLSKFSYRNVDTDDLWESLSESSNLNLKEIFDTWLRFYGTPLVYVSETNDKRVLVLNQTQFPLKENADVEENIVWNIPLSISTSLKPEFKYQIMISRKESIIKLPLEQPVDENGWYNVNTGFYSMARVKYSDELFERLLRGVETGNVDIVDRIAIILDNYEFMRFGVGKTSDILKIIHAFSGEESMYVWKLLVDRIYELTDIFYGTNAIKEMAKTSLGFMCDKDSIAETFRFALSDKLKIGDGLDILISLAGNFCSKVYLKDEVASNIRNLKKIENSQKFEFFLKVYIGSFSSTHEAIGAVNFLDSHGITFKDKNFREIISSVHDKEKHLYRDTEGVKKYLSDILEK